MMLITEIIHELIKVSEQVGVINHNANLDDNYICPKHTALYKRQAELKERVITLYNVAKR